MQKVWESLDVQGCRGPKEIEARRNPKQVGNGDGVSGTDGIVSTWKFGNGGGNRA